MKKLSIVLSLLAVCLFTTSVFAIEKEDIIKNVDAIVSGIDGGQKKITNIDANAYTPYAFIIEENGQMLVHPSLAGKNLKEVALPIYDALAQATTEGIWVNYEWKGTTKQTYVKKTQGNLIVASGL